VRQVTATVWSSILCQGPDCYSFMTLAGGLSVSVSYQSENFLVGCGVRETVPVGSCGGLPLWRYGLALGSRLDAL
jgi:hypothetical protein